MELVKNFDDLEFFNEEVKNAMIECHSLGYDVYISKYALSQHALRDKISYFDFKEPDNLAICYCQFGIWNCFDRWSISTHHKPNANTGSGWNVFDNIWDIKKEHYKKAIEHAKNNFIYGDHQRIKHYPPEKPVDFEQYKKEHYKIIF
jgi:hypothetical protein